MVAYKSGDIFAEDADALVNSVNCVGVMGRGIALQFKKRYPENFKAYKKACDRNEVEPGRMFVFETGRMSPRFIINFPTKRHWRGKSRIEDIESGLAALVREIRERGIESIAVPALGSDLGKLNWADVKARINDALSPLADVNVIVLEPGSVPADGRPNPSADVPEMTPARAVLVCLIHRYLMGGLDPFATLLEVHKLMYFMQESGEPLSLKFSEGPYGPYAETLRHLLRTVDGHFVFGYDDGGDDPTKELDLAPGAMSDATAFLENRTETKERLNKVAELTEGFESSFGLELLATAHWVADRHPDDSDEQIVERIYGWNPRKRQFSERQIGIALRTLREKGWLKAATEGGERTSRPAAKDKETQLDFGGGWSRAASKSRSKPR